MASTLRIGAHISIAGGFLNAAKRAAAIGANCLQMFSSSPHQWGHEAPDSKDITLFNALRAKAGIGPVYFHASYLLNLADEGRIGKASATTLVKELTLAPKLGVRGSVVHVGSWKGGTPDYDRLAGVIRDILKRTPPETLFIMENSGTRKIGLMLEEIGAIVKRVENERLKVCLDTCHLFTAGYDIRTKEKLDGFLKEFARIVGMERLELWHMNDSRDPFGSFRDRHENIGEGEIGKEPFRVLVNHAKMKNYPLVLEVPGFDDEGPDKKNVDILKNLIDK
ncbi:MAG: deoxyribonuclease IV [Candidatus Jorgensenbacteria bacterium]|nr:deoxyribonuclease IV [Candidatus Jorgensenbacteria bacterium]